MARIDPPGIERMAERDRACDPTGSSILAQAKRHRLASAALIGGAVAATAGAVYAARQAALRRRAAGPVNEIMATALTASDVRPAEHDEGDGERRPPTPPEVDRRP